VRGSGDVAVVGAIAASSSRQIEIDWSFSDVQALQETRSRRAGHRRRPPRRRRVGRCRKLMEDLALRQLHRDLFAATNNARRRVDTGWLPPGRTVG
jgi:hypothetical protein